MSEETMQDRFPENLIGQLQTIRADLDTIISVVNLNIGNFRGGVRDAAEQKLRELEQKRSDVDSFLESGSRLEGEELNAQVSNLKQTLSDLTDVDTGILTRLIEFFERFLEDYTTSNELRTLSENILQFITDLKAS